MSSGREAKKRADIGGFAEPIWIVDKGCKTKRYNWADARNGHEAARDGVVLGFRPQCRIKISGGLAKCCVSLDETIGNGAQNRIGFTGRSELVAKSLALPTLSDAGHTDSEGF